MSGGALASVAPALGVYGCRGLVRGRVSAGSGWFRRKWAPISPWVLDFCAVFGGSCSLPALPTWGNAGALRRFGPIRPAKPSRSCERGSLGLKAAHLNVRFGPGRKHCDCRAACVGTPSANRERRGVWDVRGRSLPGCRAPCCAIPRPAVCLVSGEHTNAAQPSRLRPRQKASPALFGFREALGATDDFAVSVLVHADRHDDRDVLAGSALWRSTMAVANLIPLSLGVVSVICPGVMVKPRS